MSLQFAALIAIRDSEGLKPQEKLCLTMIYSRGNEHTASIKTLTKNMGYKSDRHVRDILAALRDKGILNIVEHTGETHDIRINLPALQKMVPTHAPEGKGSTPAVEGTPAVERKGGMPYGTRDLCAIEPTKDNPKENMKEKEHASAGAAALSPEAKKAKTKKMTDSLIAEKRERSVVKDGEQEATHALYSMGTSDGTIDYAELAGQDKSVKFYYDKHMNIEGMKPKAAYKLACKKAGKEVKA